ncbi:class I SAM-dependent methyltransferase [Streptomyces sp. NEAU-S7GS2]|uniref:class I SAM-dependent methyltransferase n=1 Tax=Streptomyces sp. NEAU-S7GS2 TaxID=2202000 RepID=UPI000D701385|nr:class I SAM-dependent methyltransferase [Streptomyces sp. NEAU-S7GS2]AWN31258.1 SAM-dependent methyltransferase [Streptomyces sp. NEAU-S7GS2]
MPHPDVAPHPYWNHNVHYHRLVLDAVPDGCGRALDIGCGDGLLVRKLAGRIREVTGVDRSAAMVRLARERSAQVPNAAFVEADFMTPDGAPSGGFDFLTAVAVVHHLDFTAAVHRMAGLLAPGGRLVLVGLARNRTPLDWLVSGAGVPAARFLARRHGGKSGPPEMPVQDPAMAWGEVRRAARGCLPGSRFRRHLLWRYSLVWDKPRS